MLEYGGSYLIPKGVILIAWPGLAWPLYSGCQLGGYVSTLGHGDEY